MKRLLCMMLALVMMFALAACSESGTSQDAGDLFPTLDEPITITFWHSVANEDVLNNFLEVVDTFNNTVGKDNNVKVDLVQYPSAAELHTAVTGAIMSNTAPNIVMGNSIYTVDYVAAESLVDLGPYMNHEKYGINIDDYYSSWLTNCNSYDEKGTYYALPCLCYSETMYYNVDFFKEHNLTVPTTWKEAEDVCRKASQILGKGALGWDNAAKMFCTLVTQSGVGYTSPRGELLFNKDLDTALAPVKNYINLVHEGVFRTPGDSFFFSGPFANQEIPMYIGSGVEGVYIDMKIDPNNKFQWDCAPVPQMEGGQKTTFCESNLLSIVNKGSDEAAAKQHLASWIFLKYFESEEAVKKMATVGAYLPILKSVATDPEWLAQASPSQKCCVTQMDSFTPFYGFDNGKFVSSALYSDVKIDMEAVLAGSMQLQDAIDSLLNLYGN